MPSSSRATWGFTLWIPYLNSQRVIDRVILASDTHDNYECTIGGQAPPPSAPSACRSAIPVLPD